MSIFTSCINLSYVDDIKELMTISFVFTFQHTGSYAVLHSQLDFKINNFSVTKEAGDG